MSILSGNTSNAVCTGSEFASPLLAAKNFKAEYERLEELEQNPIIAFEKDFLRFMLSDGAGACLMTDTPNKNGISLKIEWIESVSYANELKTCMYHGAEKDAGTDPNNADSDADGLTDGTEVGNDLDPTDETDAEADNEKFVEHIVHSLTKHNIKSEEIDFILPHISSMYFYEPLKKGLAEADAYFSDEKWFINLPEVGNVGAAAIYLMLEQLFNSGELKPGQKILLLNPESGRFSYSSALLTVV